VQSWLTQPEFATPEHFEIRSPGPLRMTGGLSRRGSRARSVTVVSGRPRKLSRMGSRYFSPAEAMGP